MFMHTYIDVSFGFVRTSLEVDESVGRVEVCVQIFNPSPDDELNSTLTVVLQAMPVTAGMYVCTYTYVRGRLV